MAGSRSAVVILVAVLSRGYLDAGLSPCDLLLNPGVESRCAYPGVFFGDYRPGLFVDDVPHGVAGLVCGRRLFRQFGGIEVFRYFLCDGHEVNGFFGFGVVSCRFVAVGSRFRGNDGGVGFGAHFGRGGACGLLGSLTLEGEGAFVEVA